MEEKKCSKCGSCKSASEFPKNISRPDGLNYWCKACEQLAYKKEYVDYGKKYKKEYYIKNKKKILENRKKYIKENKDVVDEINKKSYNKHSVSRIRRVGEYIKRKLKTDVVFKLRFGLRSRFRQAIKNNYKSGSVIQNLGCSVEDLKLWLEQQFQEGMSWDNYGRKGWHIDHIIPLAKYDLTDKKQLKKACNWFNLRPLWEKENLKKGKR